MQALYRKYRSRSLSEVVGQEHVTQTLKKAIESGRISHAYLFTGPRGVGKTSVARILAHEINGIPYSGDINLDIIEIDAASNRRIDDIRDLREKVHIAPVSAKYKVYIIDEAHMLTSESFNALLKTLEEPPSHVVFILATTEANKLPATIVSRTQRFAFRQIDGDKSFNHLRFISSQEGISIDDDALKLIVDLGEGSMRDSISILDQIANLNHQLITTDIIEESLGLPSSTLVAEITDGLRNLDYRSVIDNLEKASKLGVSSTMLLPQLLKTTRACAVSDVRLFELIDSLLEVPKAYDPEIKLMTLLVKYIINNRTEDGGANNISFKEDTVELRPIETAKSTGIKPADTKVIDNLNSASNKPEKSTFDSSLWPSVMNEVYKLSPPLHSVLKHAVIKFEADENVLTITFQYQLHKKRAEDTKYSNMLFKAILNTAQQPPIVRYEFGTVAGFEKTIEASQEMDETTQSVAALMGGGELVQT